MRIQLVSLPRLDDQHRPLAPFVVRPADHGTLAQTAGCRPDDRLDLGRVDPLAAGLDQVLRAAADREVARLVDHREIAGVEIALLVERVALAP